MRQILKNDWNELLKDEFSKDAYKIVKTLKKINYDLNYFEITLNILNHKNRKNPSFFLFFY